MNYLQGDIFGNWKPIKKIELENKCNKKEKTKDKDRSLRLAYLYGISLKENKNE